MNKIVAASILGLDDKTKTVNHLISKQVNWIHYDVMDGVFVPNKSLPIDEIKYIVKNTKEHIVDIHLMVNDPLKYIDSLKGLFNYITFHFEAESIERIKKIFKEYGDQYNIGISVKPGTNIEQIYEFIPDLSHVLIMTVEPGKGGQTFNHEMIDKIKKLKNKLNDMKNEKIFIQVDGGINDKTGPLTIEAGAVNLVSGSFLMNNIDKDQNIVEKILNKK